MIRRISVTLLGIGTAVLSLMAVLLWCGQPAAATASGSLRFVDETNAPLAGAELRLLCYADNSVSQPLADLPAHTQNDGRLTHTLPNGCNYLAALWLRHTQPSGKPDHGPAYRVYATSWLPGSDALVPATGDVKLYDSRPLILFDVVASLAWQPAAGSTYLAEVRRGLRQASAYLYDLTEGQMAFGEIRLETNGRQWQTADLRLLTANDYRPTAYMGGIVAMATPYTAPATLSQTIYAPGAIYLGRYWNGLDAADPVSGAWDRPNAARTLVHEWGHYALFLYDEYQQSSSGGKTETYCTCLDLPGGACAASAMSYHYTAVAFWHELAHGQPAACEQTDQMLVHGEADWHTLLRWGNIQNLPGDWLQPPTLPLVSQTSGIVNDLFGRAAGYRLYLPAISRSGTVVSDPDPIEPTIALAVDSNFNQTQRNALYPQVYLVDPLQVQYQGTSDDMRQLPAGVGQMTLFGVTEADRVRAYVEAYTIGADLGGRFVYPPQNGSDLPVTPGQTFTLTAAAWEASLDVQYGMEGALLQTMTVTLSSPSVLAAAPIVQRCSPDGAVGCPNDPFWRQPMTASGAMTWTAVFKAPAGSSLAKYGFLQVEAAGYGELWRWFQSLGGVGPAYDDGEAPLLDGLVTVAATTAVPGAENQAMLMPAASYEALLAPLPPGFTVVVGLPLDLDVMVPTTTKSLVLTLFYSQAAADRLGANEAELGLLHFKRSLGQWQVVAVSDRSSLLNWVASVPVSEDGIYAIGWRPVPPPQANFDALPREGLAPLPVNFFNLSQGLFDSSLWDLGDGTISTETDPQHIYELPGVYTITLTVSGPGGSDTLVQPGFVTVLGTAASHILIDDR
ncbi:MAG: PKD domain-containing protein [Ardenticatenaceae bacterium]|nr:PKD domain-containing protein [Ardenticatenaceae bacterium]